MRAARLPQLVATVAASNLAVPSTAEHGADVSGWSPTGSGFTRAHLRLYGDAGTLTAVTLWGYLDRWDEIGLLKNGGPIVIVAAHGYGDIVTWPTLYQRLAVSATGGTNIVQEYTPLEVR